MFSLAQREALAGKRCLILGAAGFIGRHLAHTLNTHGAIVSGFGRVATGAAVKEIDWFSGQFSDESALSRALDRQQIVFHLLGSSTPGSTTASAASLVREDVEPTLAMFDLLRSRSDVKVVFASSGGTVYGPSTKASIREDHPLEPVSAYGVNKLSIERYLHVFDSLYGLDYCALRVSNPFGPGQSPFKGQGFISAAVHAAVEGREIEVWGDGLVVRDYLFIDDLIAAFISAANHKGQDRVFNIGSGVGRTLNQVIDDIRPHFSTSKLRVSYKPGRKVDVPSNVLSCSLAAAKLGWAASTDWNLALSKTIKAAQKSYS